ncbi:MAG: class I SAM-dependent methyltransferase [Candidatus Woesebacteria bacterium]|nr:class I SAM-dependent methyltransferase [Candidatus Woesebacteria bacterium]
MALMCCPSCNGSNVKTIGELIKIPGLFDLPNPGCLYHCESCNLYFRHLFFSPNELAEAYGQIAETNWSYRERRNDYRLAFETIIQLKKSGKILDIGCYRGDFLQLFPDPFYRYGIEPSIAAARIAMGKGVRIVGKTLETFESKNMRFDIITLIDVLEHLPSPFLALSKLAPLLNRNGILIISTGNTDALPWRLMRQDYWYYASEHVSFFNPKWFRWAAQQLDLAFVGVKRFSHQEGSALERWRQFAQCLTFIALKNLDCHPLLKKMISRIYPFNRAIHWTTSPPNWLWKDHQLVTLQSINSPRKHNVCCLDLHEPPEPPERQRGLSMDRIIDAGT